MFSLKAHRGWKKGLGWEVRDRVEVVEWNRPRAVGEGRHNKSRNRRIEELRMVLKFSVSVTQRVMGLLPKRRSGVLGNPRSKTRPYFLDDF